MTAAPFAYARPTSVAEAAGLLTGVGARALAGGQSLIPLLARREQRVDLLVDLFGIGSLDRIEHQGGLLRVGALVRQRAAERSQLIASACPMLVAGLAHVGHPPTRHRGTIGGSIAHADPAAELPTIAIALGASVTLRAIDGTLQRRPVAQLFVGPNRTSLRPGELVLELRLPEIEPHEGQAFLEFAPRFADLPIVAVALAVLLDADGSVRRVRAALGGIGATPVDQSLPLTELLAGEPPAIHVLESAAQEIAQTLDPVDDERGSTRFRRRLAMVLLSRALKESIGRARA